MPPNRDAATKAAQQAVLNRKVKDAEQASPTLRQEIKMERQAQEDIKRSDVTRYYIRTPLADSGEEEKSAAVKLEIQIPGGPTAYTDEDGKQIVRAMGSIILLEGEGVTTDQYWAEYLDREYGNEGWVVSAIRPSGMASYMQEIEEARAALVAQEV